MPDEAKHMLDKTTKGTLVLVGAFDVQVQDNSRAGISLAVGPKGLHTFALWLSAYLALSWITNNLLDHDWVTSYGIGSAARRQQNTPSFFKASIA
jgi:hypothetical protein